MISNYLTKPQCRVYILTPNECARHRKSIIDKGKKWVVTLTEEQGQGDMIFILTQETLPAATLPYHHAPYYRHLHAGFLGISDGSPSRTVRSIAEADQEESDNHEMEDDEDEELDDEFGNDGDESEFDKDEGFNPDDAEEDYGLDEEEELIDDEEEGDDDHDFAHDEDEDEEYDEEADEEEFDFDEDEFEDNDHDGENE